jgi:hypothetical protein
MRRLRPINKRKEPALSLKPALLLQTIVKKEPKNFKWGGSRMEDKGNFTQVGR